MTFLKPIIKMRGMEMNEQLRESENKKFLKILKGEWVEGN